VVGVGVGRVYRFCVCVCFGRILIRDSLVCFCLFCLYLGISIHTELYCTVLGWTVYLVVLCVWSAVVDR